MGKQIVPFPENSKWPLTFKWDVDTDGETIELRVLDKTTREVKATNSQPGEPANTAITFDLDTSPLSGTAIYTTQFVITSTTPEQGLYPDERVNEDILVPHDFDSIS